MIAIKKASKSIGINARKNDFVIIFFFDLSNPNSSEPSSTIKIRQMVPKNGNKPVRSGMLIFIKCDTCRTSQPSNNSNKTEGILVEEEVRSKT